MKTSITQIIQIPADSKEPVVTTVEALKDADLSTLPEGVQLNIHREKDILELTRHGENLRVAVLADFDCGEGHESQDAQEVAGSALMNGWSLYPEFKPRRSVARDGVILDIQADTSTDTPVLVARVDEAIERLTDITREILESATRGMTLKFPQAKVAPVATKSGPLGAPPPHRTPDSTKSKPENLDSKLKMLKVDDFKQATFASMPEGSRLSVFGGTKILDVVRRNDLLHVHVHADFDGRESVEPVCVEKITHGALRHVMEHYPEYDPLKDETLGEHNPIVIVKLPVNLDGEAILEHVENVVGTLLDATEQLLASAADNVSFKEHRWLGEYDTLPEVLKPSTATK